MITNQALRERLEAAMSRVAISFTDRPLGLLEAVNQELLATGYTFEKLQAEDATLIPERFAGLKVFVQLRQQLQWEQMASISYDRLRDLKASLTRVWHECADKPVEVLSTAVNRVLQQYSDEWKMPMPLTLESLSQMHPRKAPVALQERMGIKPLLRASVKSLLRDPGTVARKGQSASSSTVSQASEASSSAATSEQHQAVAMRIEALKQSADAYDAELLIHQGLLLLMQTHAVTGVDIRHAVAVFEDMAATPGLDLSTAVNKSGLNPAQMNALVRQLREYIPEDLRVALCSLDELPRILPLAHSDHFADKIFKQCLINVLKENADKTPQELLHMADRALAEISSPAVGVGELLDNHRLKALPFEDARMWAMASLCRPDGMRVSARRYLVLRDDMDGGSYGALCGLDLAVLAGRQAGTFFADKRFKRCLVNVLKENAGKTPQELLHAANRALAEIAKPAVSVAELLDNGRVGALPFEDARMWEVASLCRPDLRYISIRPPRQLTEEQQQIWRDLREYVNTVEAIRSGTVSNRCQFFDKGTKEYGEADYQVAKDLIRRLETGTFDSIPDASCFIRSRRLSVMVDRAFELAKADSKDVSEPAVAASSSPI